jgi:hypothetical protein
VLHAAVTEALDELPDGTPVPALHAAVKALLFGGDLIERADEAAALATDAVLLASSHVDAIPA